MELDFDKIIRIRKIRSVKSDLSKEEKHPCPRPVLSDKKLIPEIHKVFTKPYRRERVQNGHKYSDSTEKVHLHSPLSLFPVLFGRGQDGSRIACDELSNVLGRCQKHNIQ